MANEIIYAAGIEKSGRIAYAQMVLGAQYAKADGSGLADYAIANWATYKITLTEITGTGAFVGSVPSGLAAAEYVVSIIWQLGSTAAATDDLAKSWSMGWSGSRVISVEILADTAEIQAELADGGRTDSLIDGIATQASAAAASAAAVEAKFTGITLVAKWLGLLAGKTADATTLAEVNATTAGASFNNTTDSLEAIAISTAAIEDLTKAGGDGDLAEMLSIVSSVSLGNGARTVTITVTDGTDALENARVRVTSGTTTQVGDTNVSGVIVFGIDDATWDVVITKSGYSFTPTTLVVSANTTHTYAMTEVTIPASDPDFVTGYLYCYDENGDVEESVTIQMKIVSLSGNGSGYDTAIRSETSDADGLVTFTNLVPGALYSIRRGTETDWIDTTIPAAATSPYEMDNLFGEDS